MEDLVSIVTLLAALSVASERLVEIVKSLIPFLSTANTSDYKEGLRKVGRTNFIDYCWNKYCLFGQTRY